MEGPAPPGGLSITPGGRHLRLQENFGQREMSANEPKRTCSAVDVGSSCKFALMAIGRSKGGDMRDPDDTYQNQLVPMVVEQTNRGERAYDIIRGF